MGFSHPPLGQERKVAGEIRGQLVAGFAHPQRSSAEPPPSKSSDRASASVRRESPAEWGQYAHPPPPVQATAPSANAAAQAPSSARVGSTLGDTFDEKLGEVFKARIDELIKQSN